MSILKLILKKKSVYMLLQEFSVSAPQIECKREERCQKIEDLFFLSHICIQSSCVIKMKAFSVASFLQSTDAHI